MTRTRILCVVIIISFLAFCFVNFTKSLTPYVTFAQAKNNRGTVQVKGTLAGTGAISRQNNGQTTILHVRDETGEIHSVVYRGMLPDGLEKAESLVVIGRYEGNNFLSSKLLTKCPSKYNEKGE